MVFTPLIGKGEVIYQIFISPKESGIEVFNLIKGQILHNGPVFNITLGTANFTASIYDMELVDSDKTIEKSSQDFLLMHSAIPTKLIEDLKFEKEEFGNYNFVEEDMMPGDFVANGNREVRKMNRLLFSISPNPIRVKLNSSFYQVTLENETINIQFVDS